MLNVVIIDDEDLAIDLLKHFLSTEDDFHLMASFTSPREGLEYMKHHKPDVLLTDIQMPGISGLDLIRSLSYSPIVVLVTAYETFAQQAYELDVVDYLMKPYTKSRFAKSMDKIRQYAGFKADRDGGTEPDFMFIKNNGLLMKIHFKDILFIEGLKQYVKVVTGEGKFVTLNSMKYFEELLQEHNFKRVHKSYIVNMNAVSSATSDRLSVVSYKIPVGRSFKPVLKK